MSKIEVNTIDTQCGSALQIGDGNTATIGLGKSGDTITVPCGATIVNSGTATGFGRTGTVDWDTTPKTGTVTAATGKGYFVDTTSGGITVNLPAGAAGSIVAVSDYASTSASNNITVAPNGSEKINAVNDDYTISTAGLAVTLVYVDSTRGWKSVTGSDADATGVVPTFITATGGNQPTAGGCIVDTDYKFHKFTGPGTFCVSQIATCTANNLVSYMVVAGGGGGGHGAGGGGGAGGYRELKSPSTPYTASPLDGYPNAPNRITVTATGFPITVGGGGAGAPNNSVKGTSGVNSTFSCITSTGGGGGGSCVSAPVWPGAAGGSGGGGRANQNVCGGAGNTPPTTPAQGFAGGSSGTSPYSGCGAGGGGGATTVGGDAPNPVPGQGGGGGTGAATCISGTPTTYSGGGGGPANNPGTGGPGGAGGGGNGAPYPGGPSTAGTVNTGGGGGGGLPTAGNAGGSGIVIIRYKFQ